MNAKRWCTMLLILSGASARGIWMLPQTEEVPIERVLSNLQQQLASRPNDVPTLYYLARVHSMAFAVQLQQVRMDTNAHRPVFGPPPTDKGVPKQIIRAPDAEGRKEAQEHLEVAIGYYKLAVDQVERGTNQVAYRHLRAPIHMGYAWCLEQSEQREAAIRAYRQSLRIAWKLEVDKDVPLSDQLEYSWDQLRSGKNPFAKKPVRTALGPGVCYSAENIAHLLYLLDPEKDAREIAQLEADLAILRRMARAITPLLLPVGSSTRLDDLVEPSARVAFDLDGSGLAKCWGWISREAAWLVHDPQERGDIRSGLQMFGAVTFWVFWENGYAALRALDDDGDGWLRGEELAGMALWQDANANGVSETGEVRPLSEYGVVALRCDWQVHRTGIPFHPQGAVLRDGSTRPTFDWEAPMTGVPTSSAP